MPDAVVEREAAGRRRAVVVADREPDGNGGPDVEQDRHLAAEAEVLGPLPHVESEGRLAPARLAAVEQGQGVFHLQPAQLRRHGRAGEHLHLEEPIRLARSLAFGHQAHLVLTRQAQPGHPAVHRPRLGAAHAQRLRHRALVPHLDQHRSVTRLLEHGPGRAAADPDAQLGAERHNHQHLGVEEALEALRVAGHFERSGRLGVERRTQVLERLEHTAGVRLQRLKVDLDGLELFATSRADDSENQQGSRRPHAPVSPSRPRHLVMNLAPALGPCEPGPESRGLFIRAPTDSSS